MLHSKAPEHYRLMETVLQEKLDNGTTRCHLCPWHCKIAHGQRGFCQAHVNRNGTLYNLSYGILSAIHVNPIEEKPVRHFRPGTQVLSIGSYGCSFRCGGCHNLEISLGVTALDELAKGESSAAYVRPEELVGVALRQGVQGIAFTYSEPAVWLEYVIDVCEQAHQAGLYTVYVSNSFITQEALELAAPHIDVLCSDIKSLRDDFYHAICPTARVEQILNSIQTAQELGIHVETRTNVIPGRNDAPDELYRIACWVRDHLGESSPWHITKFFPAYKLSHVPETPNETLWSAYAQAQRAGLKNVYVYPDKGCDCAQENRPIGDYLVDHVADVHGIKKCSASCCSSEGVLLRKYE
jgi:pyruvate formate lyase activating enzyme